MSTSNKSLREIMNISVRDIEKRYRPVRCYKFVLVVDWSDKTSYIVYRSYSEFLELHMVLLDTFPVEAGDFDSKDRILPKLQGSALFNRGECHKVAEMRKSEIANYCNELLQLPPKISKFPKVLEFFEIRTEDWAVPADAKTKVSTLQLIGSVFRKKKKNKEDVAMEITYPLQLETYVAIASYKAQNRGQINLNKGDRVEVMDKNPNGWWYVSCNGQDGWAPATYLDKENPTAAKPSSIDLDEMKCLAGERHLSIKAYTSNFDDEISFDKSVVLEVLNKILDGWWIASYEEKVGYVPSTYLVPYSNPYLDCSEPNTLPLTGNPKTPTPRRQTIKDRDTTTLPSVRDLQMYRRVTEKRRQRSIKQQTSGDSSFSINLLVEPSNEQDDLQSGSITANKDGAFALAIGEMKYNQPDKSPKKTTSCQVPCHTDEATFSYPKSQSDLSSSGANKPKFVLLPPPTDGYNEYENDEADYAYSEWKCQPQDDQPPSYNAPPPPSTIEQHLSKEDFDDFPSLMAPLPPSVAPYKLTSCNKIQQEVDATDELINNGDKKSDPMRLKQENKKIMATDNMDSTEHDMNQGTTEILTALGAVAPITCKAPKQKPVKLPSKPDFVQQNKDKTSLKSPPAPPKQKHFPPSALQDISQQNRSNKLEKTVELDTVEPTETGCMNSSIHQLKLSPASPLPKPGNLPLSVMPVVAPRKCSALNHTEDVNAFKQAETASLTSSIQRSKSPPHPISRQKHLPSSGKPSNVQNEDSVFQQTLDSIKAKPDGIGGISSSNQKPKPPALQSPALNSSSNQKPKPSGLHSPALNSIGKPIANLSEGDLNTHLNKIRGKKQQFNNNDEKLNGKNSKNCDFSNSISEESLLKPSQMKAAQNIQSLS